MKKIIVTTVLALLVMALPTMATTDWDFIANGNVTVEGLTLSTTTASLLIKSGSKAESVAFSSGTLIVTDAATTTFTIYSADPAVKAIKIASSTIGCNTAPNTIYTTSSEITIASSTSAGTEFTVSLVYLEHALTYNYYCGAATCDQGYEVSGTNASATCVTCPVLTGAATYNSDVCGAETCVTGYTLLGSGASATCTPPPAIIGGGGGGGVASLPDCTSVVYDQWQTTCASGWQYRNVKSQSPSGCALTTAQQNDTKRQCSTTATPATPATPASAAEQIKNIVAEAATIAGRSVEQVLAAVGAMRDAKAEAVSQAKYTNSLVAGLKNITAEMKSAITNFVNYGTPTTKVLGAGERAGVISSYKAAFGKVPASESEWSDVIKIGNGRWPSQTNSAAETRATTNFKKIYLRNPNRSNAHDDAAVVVMAYGLRPSARNLSSEKAAIKSFKAIYGFAPTSATNWDAVRAISYSGAKR